MRVLLRIVAPALVVVALLSTTTGCRGGAAPHHGPHGPQPLTRVQAEQLAVVRFANFRSGALRGSLTAAGPAPLDAQVLIDFRRHLGLAVDVGGGRPAQVAWDGNRVWVSLDPADDPFHGHAPPLDSWSGAAMNEDDPVDLFLALVLKLGSDRPENPQLLQQSSARFLRAERIGGRDLQVFSGPRAPGAPGDSARTTYWLDADGDLVRFEAAVWGSAPSVLTLDRDAEARMPAVIGRLSGGGPR